MSQNRSTAVMQRRLEAHDSLDDFPTPPWAARALCEHVIGYDLSDLTVWEPAANRGYLVRGLKSYFQECYASDIHDYGAGFLVRDFLFPSVDPDCDWIITNPPFRLAEQFAIQALQVATEGVALLVRTSFTEGVGRFKNLFSVHKPMFVAQFTERVSMVKGRIDGKISSATSYCWIVWGCGPYKVDETAFLWIPPCKKALEREGDYA